MLTIHHPRCRSQYLIDLLDDVCTCRAEQSAQNYVVDHEGSRWTPWKQFVGISGDPKHGTVTWPEHKGVDSLGRRVGQHGHGIASKANGNHVHGGNDIVAFVSLELCYRRIEPPPHCHVNALIACIPTGTYSASNSHGHDTVCLIVCHDIRKDEEIFWHYKDPMKPRPYSINKEQVDGTLKGNLVTRLSALVADLVMSFFDANPVTATV
jgi:hypothetical protein